jgi:hypothetical protein
VVSLHIQMFQNNNTKFKKFPNHKSYKITGRNLVWFTWIRKIDRTRDGLGQKGLLGNRFYKCHRDTAVKASQHFTKASISLKMYLISLSVLEKVSISLEKSKNILNLYKIPTFLNRILHYSGNVFKKTRLAYEILIFIK